MCAAHSSKEKKEWHCVNKNLTFFIFFFLQLFRRVTLVESKLDKKKVSLESCFRKQFNSMNRISPRFHSTCILRERKKTFVEVREFAMKWDTWHNVHSTTFLGLQLMFNCKKNSIKLYVARGMRPWMWPRMFLLLFFFVKQEIITGLMGRKLQLKNFLRKKKFRFCGMIKFWKKFFC